MYGTAGASKERRFAPAGRIRNRKRLLHPAATAAVTVVQALAPTAAVTVVQALAPTAAVTVVQALAPTPHSDQIERYAFSNLAEAGDFDVWI